MATTPSATHHILSAPSRPTFACIRCAKRKVKCDRQRPCNGCVSHKVDCVFEPPRPPQKRRKHVQVQLLTDRLNYYETLLHEKGVDPSKLPETLTPDSHPGPRSSQTVAVAPKESYQQTPASIGAESEASGIVSKTQVKHSQGRSVFVDK